MRMEVDTVVSRYGSRNNTHSSSKHAPRYHTESSIVELFPTYPDKDQSNRCCSWSMMGDVSEMLVGVGVRTSGIGSGAQWQQQKEDDAEELRLVEDLLHELHGTSETSETSDLHEFHTQQEKETKSILFSCR